MNITEVIIYGNRIMKPIRKCKRVIRKNQRGDEYDQSTLYMHAWKYHKSETPLYYILAINIC
jgi:hypothetical protein